MPSYTIYANTGDGYISSTSGAYATAATGGSLSANSAASTAVIGQTLSTFYTCYEGFFDFNTSSVVGVVTSATFNLHGSSDASTTDFTMRCRLYNWGGTLTTADWIAYSALGGNTLLATFATSGFSTSGYNAFTENGTNLRDNISASTTSVVVSSSRQESLTTPTGDELVQVFTANQSGTSQDPYLAITTAAATRVRGFFIG